MELQISVVDAAEAALLTGTHCDVLDVKDPGEGTIGAASPSTMAAIAGAMDPRLPLSLSIGDSHGNPNTMALALLGASRFQPVYLKVGLLGARDAEAAGQLAGRIVETARQFGIEARLVLVGYADHEAAGSVSPLELPEVAARHGAHMCMIDTIQKDRRTPFDHFTLEALQGFTGSCRRLGLGSCLSGGLDVEALPQLAQVQPDLMGVRGAVCVGKARESRLDPDSAARLAGLVRAGSSAPAHG